METNKLDPEIYCLRDTSPFPHLNQFSYEESLMNSQINELSKGEKANNSPNKYNLRSRKKQGKSGILDQPSRVENPVKDETNNNRENNAQNSSPLPKEPVLEVREILNPPPSFSFEHEIHKIRIHVPLSELVKHEDFKKSLSKLLQSEPSCHSTDSINLQDEKLEIILGPMVEDRDDSSPPFYTSLNIHDKVLHNCLMDSGASHNLMPKSCHGRAWIRSHKSLS
jgi:hypothetical protein